MGHPVRLCNDNIQKVVRGLLRNVASSVPQSLRVAADIGEGGAQLVGDVGHELFAAFLVAVLFRHVVEHDQNTALLVVGKGGEIHVQRSLANFQFLFHIVGALQRQNFLKGMHVSQQLLIGAVRLYLPLQQVVGSGVTVNEVAGVVEGHDTVGHVEEKGV